ncbi:hypothetical protein R1sor_008946 [Riccia sorocarpa]|uniref:Reverse transcriptase zinc-binding domain-containing protein n=1 Tax=Riccia sorocarpa TaxID=122646 RepID=A0ABD3H4C9_9MARC
MKMKLLTKIMTGERTEWIRILEADLQKHYTGWASSNEGVFLIKEFLLLGPSNPRRISKTALSNWLQQTTPSRCNLEESSGWKWDVDGNTLRGWALTNAWWRKILSQPPLPDLKLFDKWPNGGGIMEWSTRWKALWKGHQSARNKLWIWRLYRHAFFTKSRGAKMGVCDDTCPRCSLMEETIEHLFWGCQRTEDSWRTLAASGIFTNTSFDLSSPFLHLLDSAVSLQDARPTLFLALIVQTRASW